MLQKLLKSDKVQVLNKNEQKQILKGGVSAHCARFSDPAICEIAV